METRTLFSSPVVLASLVFTLGTFGVGCAAQGNIDGEPDPSTQPPSEGGEDSGTPGTDSGPPKPGTDTGTPPPGDDTGTTPPPGDDTGTTPPPGEDTAPPPGADGDLVKDLPITEIAVFQGVKVDVAKAGAKVATRLAPVVAGREGVMRVYVSPGPTYTARAVTAVLTINSGGKTTTVADTKTLSGASSDGDLNSTFDLQLPAAAMGTDTTYSVALHTPPGQTATGPSTSAVYPASGAESLDARSSGDTLKVLLVPVRYNADGSGRLPDTSAAQVEAYRKEMYKLYPAKKVEITVRAPYDYASSISASGSGWSNVLQALVRLRASDGAPNDLYYFGAFEPASSFGTFCGGGCVSGLSGLLTDSRDSSGRASVGIGYTGDTSAETMAHEVGHAHGRSHANCGGASGVDPKFPYSGAGIGVYGYDIVLKTLISPTKYTDMMGYCNPTWVSDYTFGALFTRMNTVAGSPMLYHAPSAGTKYRFVSIDVDGSMTWGDDVVLQSPPFSDPHAVTFDGPDGKPVATVVGNYYPYVDIPGGYMLVPEPTIAFHSMRVEGMAPGVQNKLAAMVR